MNGWPSPGYGSVAHAAVAGADAGAAAAGAGVADSDDAAVAAAGAAVDAAGASFRWSGVAATGCNRRPTVCRRATGFRCSTTLLYSSRAPLPGPPARDGQ